LKVVAVVNNKGGVGKTTVTANLGAALANTGKRVLMIDLDPQASLTKSFFTVDEASQFLSQVKTISQWYRSPDKGRAELLAGLVVSPPRFNGLLKSGGWLELVPSDFQLTDAEVLIPRAVDSVGQVQASRFLPLHRRLAEDLTHPSFAQYEVILIDCAPNFSLTTKNAVVASDLLIIPARPDFLSTEGIHTLGQAFQHLVKEHNEHLRNARGNARSTPPMTMPRAAVLFTMVQLFHGAAIDVQAQFINEVKALGVPVFDALIRERSVAFAASGRYGVPTVMAHGVPQEIRDDLLKAKDELLNFLNLLERV
jgi:chromosome partitioning protein